MSNIYYWEKLTFSKPSFFLEKKFEEMRELWKAKRYKVYSRKCLFWLSIFSCLSSKKPCLRFFLICFTREIKDSLEKRSLENVDFTTIMNVSPNILAKRKNFKKLRYVFVDERAMITTTLISFSHWKTLVTFCLRKKGPENAFLTLKWIIKKSYRKTVNRAVNWLFNNICCYLVISCFDWKIGVFQ